MSIETLCSAADNDCDTRSLALAEGALTTTLTDAAQTHGEEDVSIDGDLEIGGQGEETRREAWESVRELNGFRCKGGQGAYADDAVGMIAEDVRAVRREVRSLWYRMWCKVELMILRSKSP